MGCEIGHGKAFYHRPLSAVAGNLKASIHTGLEIMDRAGINLRHNTAKRNALCQHLRHFRIVQRLRSFGPAQIYGVM